MAARTMTQALMDGVLSSREGECWPWKKTKNKHGYGEVWIYWGGGRKKWAAHRLAWFIANGEIPEGMVVCHKCDNPSCVNATHLFIGSQQENIQDSVSKRRRAYGPRNPNAKLDRASAEKIKTDDRPQRIIASDYGISQMAVWQIKNGKTWNTKHFSED